MLRKINYTHIALIPKIDHATNLINPNQSSTQRCQWRGQREREKSEREEIANKKQ